MSPIPCGCNKAKATVVKPGGGTPNQIVASSGLRRYDIVGPDGKVSGTFTNLVPARAEARRTGGTVIPR